jgi:HD-GYP domain-containing protein (c-di-GMP phosphodiesterase class II)
MSNNRKLGQLERMMEILNIRASTWNIVTSSRIVGNLQPEILQRSLDIVQYRHPRLKSRIIHLQNGWYFQTEGTEKITLRIVDKLDIEQWEEVVVAEMNQKIDSGKILWRSVLVQSRIDPNLNYLVTTLHHAIADGLSSIKLHGEILTYYHQISSNSLIEPIIELAALPPVEEILPTWTKGWRGKINSAILFLKMALQKFWYRPRTLKHEKYVSIPQRYSDIICRQVDPETTQKFIQHCQQNKTTVHSVLCAIIMEAIAKKLTKKNTKNIRISYLLHIDLRRRLQPAISQENMTILSTTMMVCTAIQIGSQSIWKLAGEVKQNLETCIHGGNIFNMIKIAQPLVDFCFIFPRQVAATFFISNIGKVNIPKIYGELELVEISFASSHALYAGVLAVNVVTFQEKMMLNFVFSQPATSRETAEFLANEVIYSIHEISREQGIGNREISKIKVGNYRFIN